MSEPGMEGKKVDIESSIMGSVTFAASGGNVTVEVDIPTDGSNITLYGESGNAANTQLNSASARPSNGRLDGSGGFNTASNRYTVRVTMDENVPGQVFQKTITGVSPGASFPDVVIPNVT